MQPIAVSLGDPAGIGAEIVAKAWRSSEKFNLPPFFAVGSEPALKRSWAGSIVIIDDPAEATSVMGRAIPLLVVENDVAPAPGYPTADGARCALDSLELAVGLARSGAASAVVTGPVSKAQLYDVGFTHPGQTEFVAERCGVGRDNTAMLLAGPSLKVIPVTTHMPLRDVAQILSVELIVSKGRAAARGMTRNFGIKNPRIAVSGLNPHAGEFGAFGREEIDFIEPAIALLRAEGIDATGPYAADTMFHPAARAQYDCALCMYHDQALIPLKTLHFDEGVNMTLGLPIVRTSPDHGTAFGIAGRDQANPGAMIAAIGLAGFCARQRQEAETKAA